MSVPLLVKWFIRDYKHPERPTVRLAYGVLSGWTGLAVNVLLFGVKLTVGLLSGSIAIAADAMNNLSDAGSAAVTVLGFKLSSKPADNEHPFGHGRLEYIAGVIVAVLIIAVGLDFLKESVGRIFSPVKMRADGVMLGIVAGTLLFKLWLFFFYRRIGRKIASRTVSAAAIDSLSDLGATAVVLLAVIAARYTAFPIDGCAGTVVAGLVIAGGIGVLRDTINPLLGECPDPALVENLKEALLRCRGIRGVHDIILHNYGPNLYFATAHAEVNCEGDLMSVHDTLEAAEVAIARKLPVRLVLHCDPYDTEDPTVKKWRARTEEAVTAVDRKFKLYDFKLEGKPGERTLCFHLLTPRNYALTGDEITAAIRKRMAGCDPNLKLKIKFVNAYV